MTVARVERRLAAILAADVAGYSRLMGRDEEGTLAARPDPASCAATRSTDVGAPRSRLIKPPDRISQRPPRGGLAVCAVGCDWHMTSFRCARKFDRYREIADIPNVAIQGKTA
jgi:hypothetical protein